MSEVLLERYWELYDRWVILSGSLPVWANERQKSWEWGKWRDHPEVFEELLTFKPARIKRLMRYKYKRPLLLTTAAIHGYFIWQYPDLVAIIRQALRDNPELVSKFGDQPQKLSGALMGKIISKHPELKASWLPQAMQYVFHPETQ